MMWPSLATLGPVLLLHPALHPAHALPMNATFTSCTHEQEENCKELAKTNQQVWQ